MTPGRRVLVLGGARSGKSAHAEALLAEHCAVHYVATARHDASDAEWTQRIARHQERRPEHWTTIETTDLASVLRTAGPAALVDSVTAWLTSAMDASGVWSNTDGGSPERLDARVDAVIDAWASTGRHVVAVSDEVGLGVVPETASGRLFRDSLGTVNQRLAALAEEVWLVTAGIPLRLR